MGKTLKKKAKMDVVVDYFSEGLAEDPSRKGLAGIVQNCTTEMELQAWPQDIYQQQLQDKGRCPVLTSLFNSFGIYGVGQLSHPVSCLSCVVPVACLDRIAYPERHIFHPFAAVSGDQGARPRTLRIRSGGSAWGRRSRSSLSWSGEQPSWRGEQFQALFSSTCGQRTWRAPQAPLSLSQGHGSWGGQAAARLRFSGSWGRAGSFPAPSWLRARAVPARGGLQRPSVPARRPHTPASRRYRCLLSCPPGAGPGSPERAGLRGQGRAGQGRAGGAAGGGRARGRRRGGAGRPRPRPVRGSGSSQPRCPVPTAPVAAAHEVKMVIRVFVASSSGSVAIKKRQQDVVRFLEANRIEFEEVDITMSEEKRQWMYKNIPEDRQPAQGNPLPPQIFSDDRYCGDYDGFFESKESNTVFSFLGLKPTLASKESEP
ncbi:SH3 domain-binding glutamic acid-rich-like protein 2 [Motacilla alba alba]|uniref:SH3 domain-binding glutamic acid-rich-like protein 2 n=1 Tax=Motacilla alba alba TaxID=1094192 RepID=UPI0018D5469E|nr:SH3 domain-binding glutamic acid-rich-like protein 2 [Motacilla alba alba]